MKAITIADLKKNGASVIQEEGPTYLISNSKIKGVFLPAEEYESLMEILEDFEDKKIAEQRINGEFIDSKEFWSKANLKKKEQNV